MANKVNGYAYSASFGLPVSNNKPIYATVLNLGSGTTDLYTCPVGKRAMMFNPAFVQNSAGTSTTISFRIKISGSYYRVTGLTTAGTGVLTQFNCAATLEAGESIAVLTTQAGMNLKYCILEFEDNSPLKGAKLTSFSNGNNTIYTCPAGKVALVGNTQSGSTLSGGSTFGPGYSNNSGGARTVNWYYVPNGGSPGTTNQFAAQAVVADTGITQPSQTTVLQPGDSIVINVDAGTATQFAWANIFEMQI